MLFWYVIWYDMLYDMFQCKIIYYSLRIIKYVKDDKY